MAPIAASPTPVVRPPGHCAPRSPAGQGLWRGAAAARCAALALAGLMSMATVAHAQAGAQPGAGAAPQTVRFLSAGDLHRRLASGDIAAIEAARHYIMGLVDTLLLMRDPKTCIGPDTRLNELVDLVEAELIARPQMHRYNAASFVREVIYTHVRCAP